MPKISAAQLRWWAPPILVISFLLVLLLAGVAYALNNPNLEAKDTIKDGTKLRVTESLLFTRAFDKNGTYLESCWNFRPARDSTVTYRGSSTNPDHIILFYDYTKEKRPKGVFGPCDPSQISWLEVDGSALEQSLKTEAEWRAVRAEETRRANPLQNLLQRLGTATPVP